MPPGRGAVVPLVISAAAKSPQDPDWSKHNELQTKSYGTYIHKLMID